MLVHCLFYFLVLIYIFAWIIVCLNIRVSYKAVRIWWAVFILALAFLGLYAEPSVSDDLYRHYENINRITHGTLSIKDTVRYTEFIYFWLIGKTGIWGLLPFSAVLIYGIFIWKIVDLIVYDTGKGKGNYVLLYLFAVLAGCGIFYIVSGIRFSLAVAVWYYCYLKFYKNKKTLYYLFCISLLLLHTATGLFIILALIHNRLFRTVHGMILIKIGAFIFCVFLFVRLGLAEKILSFFNFGYGKEILSKYMLYKEKSGVRSVGDIRTYLLYVYYFIMFWAALCWYRREKYFGNLAITNSFLALFTCGFVIFFERMSYLLGVTSLPMLEYMYRGKVPLSEKRVFFFVSGFFFGIMAFHSFYVMLCHTQFNGVDFRYEIFNFFL